MHSNPVGFTKICFQSHIGGTELLEPTKIHKPSPSQCLELLEPPKKMEVVWFKWFLFLFNLGVFSFKFQPFIFRNVKSSQTPSTTPTTFTSTHQGSGKARKLTELSTESHHRAHCIQALLFLLDQRKTSLQWWPGITSPTVEFYTKRRSDLFNKLRFFLNLGRHPKINSVDFEGNLSWITLLLSFCTIFTGSLMLYFPSTLVSNLSKASNKLIHLPKFDSSPLKNPIVRGYVKLQRCTLKRGLTILPTPNNALFFFGEIPQNYPTFVLVDSPKKMGAM